MLTLNFEYSIRKMTPRTLKTLDIINVTDCSRHVMRGFLNELLPKLGTSKKTGRKTSSKYSAQDLLVITICYEIESRYGIKRSYLAKLYPAITKVISKPRSIAIDAKLIISFDPISVQYVDGAADFSEGLLVPLMGVLKKVDDYLHSDINFIASSTQGHLNLGPGQISDSNQSQSAHRHAK